jgi:hypothetical protein
MNWPTGRCPSVPACMVTSLFVASGFRNSFVAGPRSARRRWQTSSCSTWPLSSGLSLSYCSGISGW